MDLALIILAAGKGTRMKSSLPKVRHAVAGRPMVDWTFATAQMLAPKEVVLVVGPELNELAPRFSPHKLVLQTERLGTGHAVQQCREALEGFEGRVLVLFGDTPLVSVESMQAMLDKAEQTDAAVVLSVFEREDGAGYGRVVLDDVGAPSAIVERKDANPEQQQITTLNGGLMLVKTAVLWDLLDQVGSDNAAGEYYLTQLVELAYQAGHTTAISHVPEAELQGVNSRVR